MKSTTQFDARAVRDTLLKRGGPAEDGFVRYAYRPSDTRWLYWEPDSTLLDRPRAESKAPCVRGQLCGWYPSRNRVGIGDRCKSFHISDCLDLMDRGATCIPAWLRDDGLDINGSGSQHRPNLSLSAQRYLDNVGAGVEDLFHHVIATLHNPGYRTANAGALRMEWPRIPLPGWPDGAAGAAGGTCSVGDAGPGTGRPAGLRYPCRRRDHWLVAPRTSYCRGAQDDGRRQHGGRRFRGIRRLGTFRNGRGRHARPGQDRGTGLHRR